MENLYQSLPLDHSQEQSRFLGVSPDPDNSDQIIAELFVAPVTSDIQYYALSYCWQSSRPEQPISINDSQVFISNNVFKALKMIRSRFASTDPLTIWIDSICINQSSVMEKNHQVPLMKQIYSNASRVLVWLGDGNETTDLSMALIEQIGRDPDILLGCSNHGGETLGGRRFWKEISQLGHIAIMVAGSLNRFLDGITSIIGRPWFQRTWTLQETALSREDPLVLCGNSLLHWRAFSRGARTLSESLIKIHCASSSQPDVFEDNNMYMPEGSSTFRLQLQEFHSAYHGGDLTAAITARDLYQLEWSSLSNFTSITLNTLATDPRDKIYGILGMTNISKSDLQVDYSKSKKDVFVDAFKVLVQEKNSFHILSRPSSLEFGNEDLFLESQDWPSWLPQFDKPVKEHGFLVRDYYRREFIYRASGSLPPAYRFCPSDYSLTLLGIPIGKVASVADCWKNIIGEDLMSKLSLVPLMDLFSAMSETTEGIECPPSLYSPSISCWERQAWPFQTYGCSTNEGELILQGSLLPLDESDEHGESPIEDNRDNEDEEAEVKIKPAIWLTCQSTGASIISAETYFDNSLRGVQTACSEGLQDAICRTLVGDTLDGDSSPAPVDIAERVSAYLPPFGEEMDSSSPLSIESLAALTYDPAYRRTNHMCINRRAFRTSNGFIGLGPMAVKEGDMVVVIAGADVPFVLRPYGKSFQLVGDCYVHGIMLGELFSLMEKTRCFLKMGKFTIV